MSTTDKTQTYKFGYTPTKVSVIFNNDATGYDVVLSKLEYNGRNLISTYTNTNSTTQASVRNNGALAWGGTYDFYI